MKEVVRFLNYYEENYKTPIIREQMKSWESDYTCLKQLQVLSIILLSQEFCILTAA